MANVITFVCTCGAKAVTTASQARRDNWKLWTGGATCPTCRGGVSPVPLPLPQPPVPPVRIKCSECDDVTTNPNERADGSLIPSIHWRVDLLTEAERRDLGAALHKGRKPVKKVPLCPGMEKPGILITEVAP